MADFNYMSMKDYVTNKGGKPDFRIATCTNQTTNEQFKIVQVVTDRKLPDGRNEFVGIAPARKLVESGVVLDEQFIVNNCTRLQVTEPEGSKIPVFFFEGEGGLTHCEW